MNRLPTIGEVVKLPDGSENIVVLIHEHGISLVEAPFNDGYVDTDNGWFTLLGEPSNPMWLKQFTLLGKCKVHGPLGIASPQPRRGWKITGISSL